MRNETINAIILCGLLALGGLMSYCAVQITGLSEKVRAALSRPERTMQTISQVVTNTQGATATITTTRNDGEALDQWLTRHSQAVSAFKNS